MFRYPSGRNMPEAPAMPGVAGGMIQPYDMGGFPVRDAALSPAAQIGTLTSALANAPPEMQRTVCPYLEVIILRDTWLLVSYPF